MNLDDIKPFYFLSEHSLDKEVFYPIMCEAEKVDCMTGYFSSGSLRELAISLSYFLKSDSAKLRFIASPNFSENDLDVLKDAVSSEKNLLPLLLPDIKPTEENLRNKTTQVLSYLIISKKLEMRVALQNKGMFHTKCWIFETNRGLVAVHGSSNVTASGLSDNFEQIAVSKEWNDSDSSMVTEKIQTTFNKIWSGLYPNITTVLLNDATISQLKKINKDNKNREKLIKDLSDSLNEEDAKPSGLKIPDWLNYTSGDFSHQGKAVEAWNNNLGRGILSIATGGGKTLTSLIAASLVCAKENRLFVIITVPTVALVQQWVDDVRVFGVEPLNTQEIISSSLGQRLNDIIRNIKIGLFKCSVVILTHDAIKSEKILKLLEKASTNIPLMLIGDEVHNLGSIGFQKSAKDIFKYRLGLSATFERQFDEAGTKFLLDYFGEVVFEFTLQDAIGVCLVPYEYHVHQVILEEDEEDEWVNLTQQIKKLSYAADFPDSSKEKEKWKILCLKRRRIIESANGKVVALAGILPIKNGDLNRSLIFCTDKDPEQLKSVNKLLNQRNVSFHQITSEETINKKKLSALINAFDSGKLSVLTSKRVLDEGFNIPQTETAYLLANNTVIRQWTQRLGRVLRKSKSTNKTKAIIHDFLVIPASFDRNIDIDFKNLMKGEYQRIKFFNNLSINGLEPHGSMDILKMILDRIAIQ
ncbi:DEAD/DEAH box helicase family protein [Thiothrix fructosivorans]|uniref:DEAD/DEAH box helicase family protein n=1 Tax=Thiothrix fructosivorans TaxID=111770 RepID=A0A8B0SPS5_9GAMM|nr:DEAD/DEAH box helicase family protein [Thiothrix fructosivorans]MBO0612505.1 DEAD/DEAH box helicase family protein [Thiothrix fructosivorans]QTX12018.1 DEAD/DEAH box helicase family protein [Thiothrix fructosivorans]